MLRWIRYFIDLCLLKAGPQDAPYSVVMRNIAILAYWSTGVVITLFNQNLFQAVLLASVQTVLLLFLTQLVLWIRKFPQRAVQTMTALMGAETIIALAAIPVLVWVSDSPAESLQTLLNVVWIALIAWEALVTAHILRHSLELPFLAGLGIALVFIYMSFAITVRFMRVMAMSVGS